MLGQIKVVRVPEGTNFLCWAGRVLPTVDFPDDTSIILDAFSGSLLSGESQGFVVPTAEALTILARDINLDIAHDVAGHFVGEAFPYIFFQKDTCELLEQSVEVT